MKLFSVLLLLMLSGTVYGTSILRDSLPYKIKLLGEEVVVYSIEQDKQILECFEERKFLRLQAVEDSSVIESALSALEVCSIANLSNRKLINNYQEQVDLYQHQESLLVRRLVIEKDLNNNLLSKVQVLEKKDKARKTRNTILYTVGGILLAGLLTGIIVKSVL